MPDTTFHWGSNRALWLAVINQQMEDATLPRPIAGSAIPNKTRNEAREWLLTPSADFDEVCALAGLDPEHVRRIAKQQIDQADKDNPTTREKTITHDGATRTIREWSTITGITTAVIYQRLKAGLPLERVLSNEVKQPRTITHDGQTHTLKDWAAITGIPYPTIHNRYSQGLSPAEILDPARRNKTGWIKRKAATHHTAPLARLVSAVQSTKASPFGFAHIGRAMP